VPLIALFLRSATRRPPRGPSHAGSVPWRGRRSWGPLSRAAHPTVIRAVNVVVALAAIVPALLVMGLVAIGVRVTSQGPVVYRQRRVGRDRRRPRVWSRPGERRTRNLGGQVFTVYKLRTMEERPDQAERWAEVDDPRVTRLGRFLRRHHLDELPQLFNVLRGDMNIVGPRPEQPHLFNEICVRVRTFSRRQCVPPGITGLAQIHLPYARSVQDCRRKLDLDLQYIRERSVWTDLAIMARTFPRVVAPPQEE